MKDFLSWMDEWQKKTTLNPGHYLTPSTSEGLRVTLWSMIDLSKILREVYKFQYVLTGRINQDPLEVM